MSSIVISGDTSGVVNLTVPAVAGSSTATLPAATGTVMVSGNMPAFSAYQSTLQSISTGTATKLQFQTKEYDTNSYFDASTNYRFTPLIAGYYYISASVGWSGGLTNETYISIYKNGSEYKRLQDIGSTTGGGIGSFSGGSLVYFNGSTDYVEIYAAQYTGGSKNTGASSTNTWINGSLMRTA